MLTKSIQVISVSPEYKSDGQISGRAPDEIYFPGASRSKHFRCLNRDP